MSQCSIPAQCRLRVKQPVTIVAFAQPREIKPAAIFGLARRTVAPGCAAGRPTVRPFGPEISTNSGSDGCHPRRSISFESREPSINDTVFVDLAAPPGPFCQTPPDFQEMSRGVSKARIYDAPR